MQRLALLALVTTGCLVPQRQADQLAGRLDATRVAYDHRLAAADLAGRNAEDAHQEALAQLDRANDELETELDQLRTRLDAALADNAQLRETNAGILEDRGRLRGEIGEMQAALADLQARKRQADARVARFRELVEKFRALIDAGTLSVKMVDGRMVLRMETDVLFRSGSADLSKQGGAALAQVGAVLAGLDERRYQVEGHTDDVPIHTRRFPSNWDLAAARAIGVAHVLVDAGVAPDRISAASYGPHRPVDTNRTDTGRARNRRIEIALVPDLSMLPGFDELGTVE